MHASFEYLRKKIIGSSKIMAKKNNLKESSFENSMHKLETIVEQLESGEITLDETLQKFEEGMKLVEVCHAKLNEAEKKLKILVKDQAGNFSLKDEE